MVSRRLHREKGAKPMADLPSGPWETRWRLQKRIGSGGQGEVYLAETAKSVGRREAMTLSLLESVRTTAAFAYESDRLVAAKQLAAAVQMIAEPPNPVHLGALKHLRISEDRDPLQATQRFKAEIKALEAAKGEPALLHLLDSDSDGAWMVTEYHGTGTLADHPALFVGNIPAALAAFRPLVAAVAKLHEADPRVIHRDIKPQNVFLGADGKLVLGDFGIVLSTDSTGERLTKTHGERVGTRDWIAPWAYAEKRLEAPAPTLDVFPLGKLLWSILSGDGLLPFWDFDQDEYNLTKRFPGQAREFGLVNEILGQCLVRKENSCLSDAGRLLALIDDLSSVIQRRRQSLSYEVVRFCTVCEIGEYRAQTASGRQGTGVDRLLTLPLKSQLGLLSGAYETFAPSHTLDVVAYSCDRCGHIQLFCFPDGKRPAAWSARG